MTLVLTGFDWISIAGILAITFMGGYLPLFRPERARQVKGFPGGQAFAAGVFLGLSLTIMIAIVSFLLVTALVRLILAEALHG